METSLPIEKYKKIRMAQAEGARTVEDLRRMTDLVIENEEEATEMQRILKNACGCNNVSVEEVARAVRNGADTVEKVTAATGAGANCDKCKGGVLQSIIKNRG
ncbi:MAG: (2Fe-2S)-binding protein [Intestinibacter bartlettii]|uniref:[2Fe-2S]-binding domain protein n=1 Tax=Intestinibacter bartlettii CAG:1329 TaxID=1263063 RepID=R5XDH0_9FIRM|nr:(2Fe-2S)-binding protein [Intestinibacter bartlettii]CDA10434.1 [2Fe-2S]-binding domain protein [Intestinibacter bartlettii CAG:1329]